MAKREKNTREVEELSPDVAPTIPPPPASTIDFVNIPKPPQPPPPETYTLTNNSVRATTINTLRRTLRVGSRETLDLLPDEHNCPEIEGLVLGKQVTLTKV